MRWPWGRRRIAGAISDDAVTIDRRWRLPAGFETPGLVKRRAKRLGTALGRAEVDRQVIRDPDGAAVRHIRGLAAVREQLSARKSAAKSAADRRRVASIEGRKQAATSRRPFREQTLERIEAVDIPRRAREVEEAEKAFEDARRLLLGLPFLERGLFNSTPAVVFVALAVATFDAAIINQILRHTPGDLVTRWFITIGIPLVIVAINHVTGLLTAVIARTMGWPRKLLFGMIALGIMLLGILLFAILIAVFRAQAYHRDVETTQALFNADVTINVGAGSLISPWWLAPLQVVASGAAVSASAFRALAVEGRRRRHVLRRCRAQLREAKAGVEAAGKALEAARAEVEETVASLGALTEEGDVAAASMAAIEAEHLADGRVERELGDASVALLQSHYEIGRADAKRGIGHRRFLTTPTITAMTGGGLAAAAAGLSKLAIALVVPLLGVLADAAQRPEAQSGR